MTPRNFSLRDDIESILSPEYYAVYDLCIDHTKILVRQILDKLSIAARLRTTRSSVSDLIQQCSFTDESDLPLTWLLGFLNKNGVLEKTTMGGVDYFSLTPGCADDEQPPTERLEHRIVQLKPSFQISLDFIRYVADNYPPFLRGEKNGKDILFTEEGYRLWQSYFDNSFIGYKIFNILGAQEMINSFTGKNAVNILELGGGTGGAAEVLLSSISQSGLMGKLASYCFTDVFPLFLRITQKKIEKYFPAGLPCVYKKTDFNESLLTQGLTADSMDMVYGVNCLHVAKDLSQTLGHVYQVLKKGGSLVISEFMRSDADDLLFPEIIFNLLDSYRNVSLDKNLRPYPGFLDEQSWIKNFREAGFINIRIITNLTAQGRAQGKKFAGVIVGDK